MTFPDKSPLIAPALEEQLKVDREELGALETLAQTPKEAFERANAQAAAAVPAAENTKNDKNAVCSGIPRFVIYNCSARPPHSAYRPRQRT